ncbi:CRAL/TRIO domain-containing protein [Serendipita vermifera]|nr:CRAL/TRIO domain-containing protein [Serendipita vermifera]
MSSETPAVVASQEEHVEPPKVAPETAATTSANAQEPQNRFTEAFTEQEWEGVKKLRSLLPEISAEAYDNKEKVPRLWGVELSSTSPTAKASVVLVKFIRARQGDLEAAKTMLVSTLKWREEFKVDHLAKEEFPEDVFGKVGVISGKDKEGRPVTYNFYGSVSPEIVFKDVDQFLRWRVNLMERGISLINFETVDSMVQVHGKRDVGLASVGLGGRTANSKAAASQASQIFSDYYPELLHKKFFVSVPTLLTWIFWTFTKLLSPATQKKMAVVGSGPATISEALLPVISKEELLKRYGGEGADI